MIKQLELSDSQHQAWDKFIDSRAVLESQESRFLNSCFKELGGEGQWQFDYPNRRFLFMVPDAPTTTTITGNSGPRLTGDGDPAKVQD